jgi:hypothetical protein
MTVTTDRHAARLVFQTVNKPSAEYMRLSWMPLGAEVAPGSSITCGNLFCRGMQRVTGSSGSRMCHGRHSIWDLAVAFGGGCGSPGGISVQAACGLRLSA